MPSPVQAIIFDYGNVLCEPQQRHDLEAMSALLGISPDDLSAAYWRHRAAYDRADLDNAAYWTLVAGSTPDDQRLAQLVEIDTKSWLRPRPATLPWVEAARNQGLRTALLSNLPVPLRDALENDCSWMPRFDVRTYSCDVRSSKPDRAIYDHCVNELGVKPENAVFLDDRPENVEGAARTGIHALLFQTVVGAARDLAALGIPVS